MGYKRRLRQIKRRNTRAEVKAEAGLEAQRILCEEKMDDERVRKGADKEVVAEDNWSSRVLFVPPHFSGKNYEFWAIKMRSFLRAEDLWCLVQNDCVHPLDLEAFEALTEDQKLQQHELALHLIQRAVDESIFHKIAAAKTSKEAWRILEEEFSERGSNMCKQSTVSQPVEEAAVENPAVEAEDSQAVSESHGVEALVDEYEDGTAIAAVDTPSIEAFECSYETVKDSVSQAEPAEFENSEAHCAEPQVDEDNKDDVEDEAAIVATENGELATQAVAGQPVEAECEEEELMKSMPMRAEIFPNSLDVCECAGIESKNQSTIAKEQEHAGKRGRAKTENRVWPKGKHKTGYAVKRHFYEDLKFIEEWLAKPKHDVDCVEDLKKKELTTPHADEDDSGKKGEQEEVKQEEKEIKHDDTLEGSKAEDVQMQEACESIEDKPVKETEAAVEEDRSGDKPGMLIEEDALVKESEVNVEEEKTTVKEPEVHVQECAYDLDQWKNISRCDFNAQVTHQDMMDTFQPPFETCVKDGDASSAMCSYNQVNGLPTCADPKLLGGTIRGEWKLNGYIVSDCDSIQVLFAAQNYTTTPEDAVAQVLRSGLDLDWGSFYPDYLQSAVLQGKVKESDMDKALINAYAVLMRVGLFEVDEHYPNLGAKDICTAQNQELAVEAAREGIPCKYTPPAHGLGKYAKVVYRPGCSDVACNNSGLIPQAVMAVKKADATIMVVGLDLKHEAEGLDRECLMLMELVTSVANASKGPVIPVIMSGCGIDVSFAQNLDQISGILWAGYPGQGGGDAIAQVILGTYNPGSRLPMTWYPEQYVKQVSMAEMQMRANSSGYPGRTYRFYKGDTVYPFGYGLSYTNFTYQIRSHSPRTIMRVPLAKNQKCYSLFQALDTVAYPCESIQVEVVNYESKEKMPPPDNKKGGIKRPAQSKSDFRETKRSAVDPMSGKILQDVTKQCGFLLSRRIKHKLGWVFKAPVDTVTLRLHDYHTMDLGTVKAKLNANEYKSSHEFAADIRLTFNNAMTYNPIEHEVHTMAEQMLQFFEDRWKPICDKYEEEKRKLSWSGDDGLLPGASQNIKKLPFGEPTKKNLKKTEPPLGLSPRPLPNAKSKASPALRAPALKKPKAKDLHKREMTYEEKQKLSASLQSLPAEKLENIVQIIKKRNPSLCQQEDEIEVDIDSFDTETLWELDRFVNNCKKSMSKNKKKANGAEQVHPTGTEDLPARERSPVASGGETPKKHKKGEQGEEDVDIDDDMPSTNFPPVEIDKDGGYASKSSSSSSSSSDSGSSSSDSDSGSSSGSDSDADDAHSPAAHSPAAESKAPPRS